MIEISAQEVEKSEDSGVVYALLEDYIGRKLRVQLMSEGYGSVQIRITTGVLKSLSVVEEYDYAEEDKEKRSSFDELSLAIDSQEDDIEVDFDENQLQVEAFQEDSGKWLLIYRSKRWHKLMKKGYLE